MKKESVTIRLKTYSRLCFLAKNVCKPASPGTPETLYSFPLILIFDLSPIFLRSCRKNLVGGQKTGNLEPFWLKIELGFVKIG